MRLSLAAAASPDSSIERLFCENEPEPLDKRARAEALRCSVLPPATAAAVVERLQELRRPRPLERRVALAARTLVGKAPVT